ncbi:MAG: CusA/CzcA family heavy metal efflux RND transporter [Proteobacteria bacterium]|nr:CusA/CzcA family heavy metal efflux RND transporter [Pseudomonadota bacterium]
MIARIIRLCAANPAMTILAVLVASVLTALSLHRLPLDALPDLSDTQVIVFGDWPGRSPDLVEDQVTYPLVTALLSSPKVKYVRGLSMVGAAQIVVVFEDGTDLYWARSRILEKLASVTSLPSGVTPSLGPDATGLGWVYQYAVVDRSGHLDLAQLRALQDWNLRFALQSVHGVAEVAAVGGFVKQYQVLLDPVKLQALRISPLQVSRAIRAGNQEVGANAMEMAGTEYVIRGRGYVHSLTDLAKIPVVSAKGRVVTVGEVGRVQAGPAPRSGAAELDGQGEAVGGIIVMRVGENAVAVIDGVKKRLEELKSTLPPGVDIVPVYDRSDLIHRAISTVQRALAEELLVVALIVSLFLWHARSSWVAILPLPIAVLLSFVPMMATNLTVNIMSLGGIALAIGAMVDAGIILVENAHKRLEGRNTNDMPEAERRHVITEAMVDMGKPLFFSLLVITVSFLPIFALTGREGRLFMPLAFTKSVSMAWAAVLAITLTPALAVLFLKGRFVSEQDNWLSRQCHRVYSPVIDFVVRRRHMVIASALGLILISIPVFLALPSEFMPALNEGTILYMPTAVAGMSIDTAVEVMQKQNQIIRQLPEVERVFAKAGRSNSATDPAPLNMFETVITLKPKDQWRAGLSYDDLIAELDRKLRFPGMPNVWWMPIQTRIEMLSTGIRTAVGIKVLGEHLAQVEATALDIEHALQGVKGTRQAFAERNQAGSYIDIDVKREIAAVYGLNIADIHQIIETVLGGTVISTAVEGRERYAIQVRYASDFRQSLQAIRDVSIPLPSGGQVQLAQVADVRVSSGASMIASENAKILGLVYADVEPDMGLAEYVTLAKAAVAKEVKLPEGVRLEFSGQFEALSRAKETLTYVVPLTLLIIILLLYLNTKSGVETGIVLAAVPFSLIGAVWLMWLLHYKFSVASWVGLLALAGLDAETGVVMLLYLTQAYDARIKAGSPRDWQMLNAAIHEGAVQRIRPKLMTVGAAMLGLLPVMWSTGTGAEVMKRIAAPMVGGVTTSGLLELLVYPAIFAVWKGRGLDKPT